MASISRVTLLKAPRRNLLAMAGDLAGRGAQAAAIACTELPLLAETADYPLPAFDVVRLHVEGALDLAIGCERT
ncbi:hypothetical protein LXM94_01130 [Rhizobium sp. TRM95111]|nr:hypothetical protein [Rhizobium alarense]